jgi:RNA polymerase sigma-70 factor (ECF subfamily)
MAQDEAAVREMIRHYPNSQNLAEEKLLSKEYRQWIQHMLQTLPVQTRRVLELCRDQDMSYEEAAMVLKISRNAVKKHMVRANKVFKSSFKHLLGISIKLLVMLLTVH